MLSRSTCTFGNGRLCLLHTVGTPTVLSQQRESDQALDLSSPSLDRQVDLRYNPGVQFKPVWTTKTAAH